MFDVIGLRPDATIDEAVLVVGEVHQTRKALSEVHRVEDGEHDTTGRRDRKKPEHKIVQRPNRERAP